MNMELFFQGLTSIATVITAYGVYVAYKTLKANHDWNRRHLAIEKIIEIRTFLKDYRNNEFEKKLHYSDRQVTEPYKVTELHLLMCKTDSNGKLIWDNNKHCELTEEGRILCNQIAEFLDIYEIIADAVLETTFDEEIVKNLLKGSMTRAYYLFSEYILHLREHYKRPLLYKNLEDLVKKWEKEEIKVSKRTPTG